MTTGFRNSAGTDFDSLFDPYVQGTKPANTGLRTSDGADLVNRYAPISFGTKGADVGFRTGGGQDVSNLWAAKGTATYPLGFNGGVYSREANRGSAGVSLTMKSDGTWSISTGTGTPTSGTWLNFGGAVSDYTVQCDMVGFSSGSVPGGGTASYSNGAPTQQALSTNRTFSCTATATVVSTTASNGGIITVHLYKNGVLVSTSQCNFSADASGN